MEEKHILAIGEALRVAYLRGTRDPNKEGLTETLHELRDYLIEELSEQSNNQRPAQQKSN